jgi:hypothetical protein
VNRRRLRTLLPLPAPGALVPVGAAIDLPIPVADAAPAPMTGIGPPPAARGRAGAAAAPADLDDVAPLAAAAAEAAADDGPAVVDPLRQLAGDLVERFAAELVDRALEGATVHGPVGRGKTLPVLRRNVFRRPLGRLLRSDSGGRLIAAMVRVRAGEVEVVRGRLPDDVATALAATLEEDPAITGDWGLCHGAFGYVLAEVGAPLRAIESLSSSVSYAHILDGAQRLDEAADRLTTVAGQLERLAGEGWTLSQPIAGFWLRLRPPLSGD